LRPDAFWHFAPMLARAAEAGFGLSAQARRPKRWPPRAQHCSSAGRASIPARA